MNRTFFLSMRMRLSIWLSLVAVFIISLFSYISWTRERDVLRIGQLDQLSVSSEITALKIDEWIRIRMAVLESRKTIMEKKGSLELIKSGGPSNNPFLHGDSDAYGVDILYLGTPDGKFYYGGDWLSPPEFDPTSRPWFRSAAETGATIFTDYYVDANTGELIMSIASPLYNGRNKLLGVVGLDLFLDEMIELLDETGQEGIDSALIDKGGLIVAHPDAQLIGTDILDLKDDENRAFLKPVLDRSIGHLDYTFQGEDKALVWSRTPSLGWKSVFFVTEEYMFAPLRDLLLQIFGFVSGSLVLFIILIYIIVSFFVKRIQRVSHSLKDIAEGEGDLTRILESSSNDELTLLTDNFNKFISLIRVMISSIKRSADSTLRARDMLAVNTEEVAGAINQISANMNSMEVQIKRLDESISISSGSMDIIGKSVHDFHQIREQQASIVDETTALIGQMIGSLQQVARISLEKKGVASVLTETARKGGDRLENLRIGFDENVVSRLGDIEDMTDLIREIAGQINLLSINAAIEAAHAGEMGKGFAVVADEIRKLAESSSNSVKTIESLIGDIRQGVIETVDNTRQTAAIFDHMNKVVSEFVEALNQIANNTNELMIGSRDIEVTAQRLNSITVTIKDSSDSIKGGMEELNREMGNIEDVSRSVLGGVQEAAIGSKEIVAAMCQVSELHSRMTGNSEKLQKEIDRFKIE